MLHSPVSWRRSARALFLLAGAVGCQGAIGGHTGSTGQGGSSISGVAGSGNTGITGIGGGAVSSTGTGAADGEGGTPCLAALGSDCGAGSVLVSGGSVSGPRWPQADKALAASAQKISGRARRWASGDSFTMKGRRKTG